MAAAILGGFQVNALFTAGSGEPLNITQANTNTILAAQRPNVVDPSNLGGKLAKPRYYAQAGAYQWLIRANEPGFPFAKSSNLGIGNLGRNRPRVP